jgi:hypothetical protein
MGTRHLIGFTHQGITKASYGQYDGYPEGVGMNVLAFARGIKDSYGFSLGSLVDALVVVPENGEPTKSQALAIANYSSSDVSTGKDWYSALRGCQGDLDAIIQSGYILDSFEFGKDGLFCEWAYIVDIDNNELHVYAGLLKEPTVLDGLWDGGEVVNGYGYLPIQKIASFSLDNLPTDEAFISLADVLAKA